MLLLTCGLLPFDEWYADHDTVSTHEEADTRMFLHAKHAAIGGSKSINIVSSDTDVVVIGVAVFFTLCQIVTWRT
jgi:hypothetical protein